MSNIDKQWLQQKIAEMEATRDEIPFGLDEDDSNTLAALRIALASLETEPAIHRWRRVTVEPYGPYPWHYGNFIGFSKPVEGIEDEYYYSAPPATVSVNIPRDQIRDIFMKNGFTIKEGQADLKDYVYAAADDLISLVKTPASVSVTDAATAIRACLEEFPESVHDIVEECAAIAENACRAAMLHGAENAESRCTIQTAPALDSLPKIAESRCSNSPVIPDGGEHGFCQKHPDTSRLTHPYKQLSTYPPRPSTYCPKCDPEVAEWVELDKQLRKDN